MLAPDLKLSHAIDNHLWGSAWESQPQRRMACEAIWGYPAFCLELMVLFNEKVMVAPHDGLSRGHEAVE